MGMTEKLESVEICKAEIDAALKDLERVSKTAMINEFYIINPVEIIRIFTEILIKHIENR
jgi:hypothetical protein